MLVARACHRTALFARSYGTRRRSFHASSLQYVQRLLWAGSVLDQTSSTLREVPKDWLLSVGAQEDVDQGISFTALAASPSHILLSYTTLPPSLPESQLIEGDEPYRDATINPSGLHKVVAIGRNTYGELGLGYASQESTWGLVARGFEGTGGIQNLGCGLGSSWIVTSELKGEYSSRIYSFGNHTSGQLGLGGESLPYALSHGGEPQLQLFSSPREVQPSLESDAAYKVESIASGLDHTLVLLRLENGRQMVCVCGINTDGQLGVESIRQSSPSLIPLDPSTFQPRLPPVEEDPIVAVAAGGDTSAIRTLSGRVWAWANSEYGQALVKGEAIDRIVVPTEATSAFAEVLEGKLIDLKFGGSFCVMLDEFGNVYTAGFGAIGQGKEKLLSHKPVRILRGARSISSGLEQASAVLEDEDGKSELMVWGLDSAAGRLGLGLRKPYPSYMLASRFTPDDIDLRIYQPLVAAGLKDAWIGKDTLRSLEQGIISVVHGRDVMFVLVEDGVQEIGRWSAKVRF